MSRLDDARLAEERMIGNPVTLVDHAELEGDVIVLIYDYDLPISAGNEVMRSRRIAVYVNGVAKWSGIVRTRFLPNTEQVT